MSGFSVKIDDTDTRRLLGNLSERVRDMNLMMEAIGMALTERARLQFHDQKDPWGTPWQPLGPLTEQLRRRGRGGGSHQILRDTGRLMNSITYRAAGHQVEVGTNVIYAAIHQFGGTIYPKNYRFLWAGRPGGERVPLRKAVIPARPYLPIRENRVDLPERWRREVLDIANHFLDPNRAR